MTVTMVTELWRHMCTCSVSMAFSLIHLYIDPHTVTLTPSHPHIPSHPHQWSPVGVKVPNSQLRYELCQCNDKKIEVEEKLELLKQNLQQ